MRSESGVLESLDDFEGALESLNALAADAGRDVEAGWLVRDKKAVADELAATGSLLGIRVNQRLTEIASQAPLPVARFKRKIELKERTSQWQRVGQLAAMGNVSTVLNGSGPVWQPRPEDVRPLLQRYSSLNFLEPFPLEEPMSAGLYRLTMTRDQRVIEIDVEIFKGQWIATSLAAYMPCEPPFEWTELDSDSNLWITRTPATGEQFLPAFSSLDADFFRTLTLPETLVPTEPVRSSHSYAMGFANLTGHRLPTAAEVEVAGRAGHFAAVASDGFCVHVSDRLPGDEGACVALWDFNDPDQSHGMADLRNFPYDPVLRESFLYLVKRKLRE